ncbi:MAG: replicative DNA helicase [Candidatus Harrisonbacteria bacterium RIFCSPLOWO2_02_FULL_41_13b]|uniref:Replicative DNA helicase n=1 Tax=Candidatus Harrisonbacteria bacterium RIFCSPLOWO2_02_FULL_41_13b TaxID=1798409 RepID=A0A1G1ZRV9_9BACT|nr:MAG: replicative DNA helicase [Candidatus Harrisonbacteria bacterium RIFCSPHIGHO2_02_FULL_40_20]OGY66856.1 MAG: replicative DNA helicase [Candidatus Harrisonbacteria bacterium RIFCSPLOWO2_02_FULL_41_13b]
MSKKNLLKLPPQNIEAEQAVLGALMLDNKSIIQVADTLKAEDFYQPGHNKIYEAILKLYEKNHPVDILSVSNRLKEDKDLEEIGGASYLASLIETVPSSFHISHYADLVKEKKILRSLISAANHINEKAFDPGDDLENVLDDIEQKIFSISQNSVQQKFISVKEDLQEAYDRLEKMTEGEHELRGISTGFHELDSYLSGFQKSDLIVLGARPSLGKTAFALDIVRNIAFKEKKPIGFFSLEMSRDQVVDRLIAAEAKVPLWHLRTGRIKNETDFSLIRGALDRLSQTLIFIDDMASPNILQLRSKARRLQTEHGLSLIVVDYLQLIQPRTNSDNVVQQITEISRGLKSLAKELQVPVLAISQLSRGVEQREVKIPRLADLRDSGSIEQDSDVVMFIYRKDKSPLNPEDQNNVAEIIIAKHRNGPTGTVKLAFDQEKVSFRSIDKQHTQEN